MINAIMKAQKVAIAASLADLGYGDPYFTTPVHIMEAAKRAKQEPAKP